MRMVRGLSVDQKLLIRKRGMITTNKFSRKRGQKMTTGVRVLINTKDNNDNPIVEYGYITRRLNAQLYEVWGDPSKITYLLSPKEFTEITSDKEGDLYGIRNKIR